MAATTYDLSNISTPYNQDNINKVMQSYQQSMNPQYANMARKLKSSYAGDLQNVGYKQNLGQLATQQGQDYSGYLTGLQNTGLSALNSAQEAERARQYQTPFTEAGLTGMYDGKRTLAGINTDVNVGALTGTYDGKRTEAGSEFDKTFGETQATNQLNRFNSLSGLYTSGYLDPSKTDMSKYNLGSYGDLFTGGKGTGALSTEAQVAQKTGATAQKVLQSVGDVESAKGDMWHGYSFDAGPSTDKLKTWASNLYANKGLTKDQLATIKGWGTINSQADFDDKKSKIIAMMNGQEE